jgi:hypothetical protein
VNVLPPSRESRGVRFGGPLCVIAVLAAAFAGCGSSSEAAKPERYLKAHWPSRSLTIQQVTRAIGDADSMRVVTLKDVYGKPYLGLVSRWNAGNGSVVMSNGRGKVTLVIPNLKKAGDQYAAYKRGKR